MICCPFCDYENIEGVDQCEQCGQPLDDLCLPDPTTAVERGLLVDCVDCLKPKQPIVVSKEATVAEVLKIMADRRIGCVFVVDGEKLVGVFSEKDVVLRLSVEAPGLMDQPVSRFMTPHPQGVKRDDKIVFAVHKMDLGGYRHLPVVDEEGRAEGVISARDILRYLTSKIKMIT